MHARIAEVRREAVAAQSKQDAYAFLPDIIDTLEAMDSSFDSSGAKRKKLAGGLGRLVLEDSQFASSPLGEALLAVADEFADGSA